MNKAFTTVLVTGATVAGVAGVLLLNPSAPSLGAANASGTRSGLRDLSQAPPLQRGEESGEGSEHGGYAPSGQRDEEGEAGSGSGSSSGSSSGGSSSGSSSSGSSSSGSSSSGSSSGSRSSGSSASASHTYTGSTYQSPYGPMQVSIAVSGGRITDIQWQQIPQSDGHSYRINSYAAPLLVEQGLKAQSASVDGVSGASYTTEGFRTSLQSAIQKAGL